MTVYVTGDVHGRAEYGSSRFAFKNWPLGQKLDSRRGGGNPLVKGVKLAGSISRFKKYSVY